ncbi:MAG TPA: phage tail sheath subtilisin-like domain-containing protein [Chloroflexaceae bacterium]|nr:phage tail sheath subtilisin-like domain-containing protein [Chloroflexaceae bacterium]
MPQYLAPGVYVEEVPAGARPIAGVGTSTAGFIGLVAGGVEMPLLPGSETERHSLARANEPRLVTSWEQFKAAFGDIQAGNLVLAHAVYGFFNNGGTRCFVCRVDGDGAAPAPAPTPTPTPESSKDDEKEETGAAQPSGSGAQPEGGGADPQASGGTQPAPKTTRTRTKTTVPAAGAAPSGAISALATTGGAQAPAGADPLEAPLIAAIDAFKTVDEVAIMAIPGATSAAVQKALIAHCEHPFQSDRFAILDGQRDAEPLPAAVQGGAGNSSYAALYYPWIQVFDPVSKGPLVVPPSGHIAGVYARVDSTRGVHKAPANEVIRGALAVSRPVSREEQAGLNPAGVNVIRAFGNNITIWGARTLADPGKEPHWKYINVRRLFLFLRESIDEGTQWVTFEPNDEALWGKIRRNVSAFLTLVWRSGALFGSTPDEAFFVRCDGTLNDLAVREQGLVITEIGVAAVNPAEFVVFRIGQWSGPEA